MLALPIKDLFAQRVSPLNWYVKLSQDHYVLVFKSGSVTSEGQMKRWLTKGVGELFVNLDEYMAFASQTVTMAYVLAGTPGLSLIQKVKTLRQAGEIVMREVMGLPMNLDVYIHIRTLGEAVVNLSKSQVQIKTIIDDMVEANKTGNHHWIAVSILSILIAKEMKWNNPHVLSKVAISGYLHDVGENKIPKNILAKPVEALDPAEKAIYKNHTTWGKEFLEAYQFIPEDVTKTIAQHHECADGSGFPNGLKDEDIYPTARIVAIANAFYSYAIQDQRHPNTVSLDEAMRKIEAESSKYNIDAIGGLRRLAAAAKTEAA